MPWTRHVSSSKAHKSACTPCTRVVRRQRVVCTPSTTCRVLVRILHYSQYRRVLGHVSPHNISGFSFKKYFEGYLIFTKHLWGFYFFYSFFWGGGGGSCPSVSYKCNHTGLPVWMWYPLLNIPAWSGYWIPDSFFDW